MAEGAVRLAVVGAGRQCTAALMPGIPYIPEIDLVAVCDLDETLAARNARNFGARASYADVATMLRQEAPDAVRAAGKAGQVGHMMRHAEPVRIAWELSHAAEFGAILSVESKYTTWPTRTQPPGRGWGEPDEDWTYMLVQGGHPIDLLRHFIGPIVRVAAFRSHGAGSAKVYQVTAEGQDGHRLPEPPGLLQRLDDRPRGRRRRSGHRSGRRPGPGHLSAGRDPH